MDVVLGSSAIVETVALDWFVLVSSTALVSVAEDVWTEELELVVATSELVTSVVAPELSSWAELSPAPSVMLELASSEVVETTSRAVLVDASLALMGVSSTGFETVSSATLVLVSSDVLELATSGVLELVASDTLELVASNELVSSVALGPDSPAETVSSVEDTSSEAVVLSSVVEVGVEMSSSEEMALLVSCERLPVDEMTFASSVIVVEVVSSIMLSVGEIVAMSLVVMSAVPLVLEASTLLDSSARVSDDEGALAVLVSPLPLLMVSKIIVVLVSSARLSVVEVLKSSVTL